MCYTVVPQGILLKVHAHPGARKNDFSGLHNGMVKISTTAAPEKGKANAAIGKFLAKILGISAGRVHLQSGETAREKVFLLEGLDPAELEKHLPQS